MEFHIFPDICAAGFEGREFVFGKVIFDDLFHAVCADDGRDADVDAVLAVLAVKERADGDDGFLVVDDRGDQAAERRADAVLGAAFAVDGDPGVGDGLFFHRVIVEYEAGVFSGQVGDGLAAEGDLGPGDHDGVAVLAHHAAGDRVVGDAGLEVEDVFQAGGVKAGAGAEDVAPGKAGEARDLAGDDVAGVGDVDPEAVEAAGDHLGDVVGDLGDGEVELVEAVMVGGREELDFPDGVDDDVDVCKIAVSRGIHGDGVGAVGDGVADVLDFAAQFCLFVIDKYQFVGQAAQGQRVGAVGSDVSEADDGDLSFLQHICISLLNIWFGNVGC